MPPLAEAAPVTNSAPFRQNDPHGTLPRVRYPKGPGSDQPGGAVLAGRGTGTPRGGYQCLVTAAPPADDHRTAISGMAAPRNNKRSGYRITVVTVTMSVSDTPVCETAWIGPANSVTRPVGEVNPSACSGTFQGQQESFWISSANESGCILSSSGRDSCCPKIKKGCRKNTRSSTHIRQKRPRTLHIPPQRGAPVKSPHAY